VKKSSGSDEDTKMINKLRKDKNRGSRVRIVEAMLENASQHAWKKRNFQGRQTEGHTKTTVQIIDIVPNLE